MITKKLKYVVTAGILFISIILNAQPDKNAEIFSNTHGLTKEGSSYFEAEGYSIFSHNYDNLYFDKGGIKTAKRKNKIHGKAQETIDSTIKIPHKIFIANIKITEDLIKQSIYYFVPRTDNKLTIIGFSISPSRDIAIERLFVKSILENKIPENIFTQTDIDSINFVGRYLPLGSACHWMGPHSVQCPDFGQISWSQFRTMERATEVLNTQFEITANKGIGEVLKKDSINVLFEGKETRALKTIYKIKIPKVIMGGSNILVIYYIATEIRGKYIACVMSHYTGDVNTKYLAPLLDEVMELK